MLNAYSKIMSGACAFVLLVGGTVYAHQRSEIDNNTGNSKTSRMIYKQSKDAKRNFTRARLKHHIDATDPNLSKLESEDSSQFKQGVSLAYSDTHTDSAYNHNMKKITQLLGPAVAQKVLGVVKPQDSMAFTSPKSPSDHMISCNVAYGAYDEDSSELPMTITVVYKTPAYDPMAGAGLADTHQTESFDGFTVIKGQINTQDNGVRLTDAYNKIDDNGSKAIKKSSEVKVRKPKHSRKHFAKESVRRHKSRKRRTKKSRKRKAKKVAKHAKR